VLLRKFTNVGGGGGGGGVNCTSHFGDFSKLLRACDLYSNGSDIHCEIAKVRKLVRHWLQGSSISRNKCIELFLFCVFSIHSIVLGFFPISCVLHHPLAMAFSRLHQYFNLNI